MIGALLTTTTEVGNLFNNIGFGLFGSAEFFGFAILIIFMIMLAIAQVPTRFMLIIGSIIIIAFKFIYGGALFNTFTVMIVIIYAYLIVRMFINAFWSY